MAGGGPNKRKSGTGAQRPGKDPCDINFTAPLAHVRTSHTAALRRGDTLDVSLETVSKRKTVVCRIKRTGEIAGYILARGAAGLPDCIELGHVYSAEIRKIDFGFIEVAVRRSA
jgi:hypothetical protein